MLSLQPIDDQGQVWDRNSTQLRRAYDSPYSGGNFSDYAVATLGFIAPNVYGDSAQIRLRPDFTADAAFDALYRWLLQRRFCRILLTWLDATWQIELLHSNQAALVRLDDLVDVAKRRGPVQHLSRRLEAPTARHPRALQELFRDWPRLSANHREEEVRRHIEPLLGRGAARWGTVCIL